MTAKINSYQKQSYRIKTALSFIQRHGQIHKFDLMSQLEMSISEYNQIKSLLEYQGEKEQVFLIGNFWRTDKEPEREPTDITQAKEILKSFRNVEDENIES